VGPANGPAPRRRSRRLPTRTRGTARNLRHAPPQGRASRLVADVAHSAFGAAFRDNRFPALEASELDQIETHISILSPLEPLSAPDEKALLDAIRPGIDGLVVRDGARQGTFLPAVWESLPEPAEFWRELKRKAGISLDAWSSRWEIFRYTVESLP